MMAIALRWRDPSRYRDNFFAILLSHGIGMGLVLKGELFTGTQSSGGEFGHMIHGGRRALQMRPTRLHRSLCRRLRDLAKCKAEERGFRARGRDHQRRHAGARRARPGSRWSGTRGLPQGRHGDRLWRRQPVRTDRPGTGRLRGRRRRRLRPARTCDTRSVGANRRWPACGCHFLRHDRRRTAAHPARLRHAGAGSSSIRRFSRQGSMPPMPWREASIYAGSKRTGALSRFRT